VSEILRLTLKREYFAQIAEKQKHTEYREQKPYWRKRLEGRKFKTIQSWYFPLLLPGMITRPRGNWLSKPCGAGRCRTTWQNLVRELSWSWANSWDKPGLRVGFETHACLAMRRESSMTEAA
jgi:hypothetical protein